MVEQNQGSIISLRLMNLDMTYKVIGLMLFYLKMVPINVIYSTGGHF